MDYMMEGHTTYDVYSYFQIYFYPCVNTTENNNKCKSPEIIQSKLGLSLVSVKIQDVELTPEYYDSPTEVRGKELTSPAYLNLYQNIQAYFHIVHVETDIDFIGFELFKNIQTKTYFKYDDTFILPSINTVDINIPYQAYCHVSIQLTEQILTLKRSNTKLTEVLGEVGGLMEVIFSLFRIISSFLTDNLYEQALVNNLFTFDLDKKIIKIKEKKKNKNFPENEDVKIYNNTLKPSPTFTQKTININDDQAINTRNKLYDLNSNNTNPNTNNDNLLISRNIKSPKKKKMKSKMNFSSNLGKSSSSSVKSKFIFVNKNEDENNIYKEKDLESNNINNNNIVVSNPNEAKDNEKEKEKETVKDFN